MHGAGRLAYQEGFRIYLKRRKEGDNGRKDWGKGDTTPLREGEGLGAPKRMKRMDTVGGELRHTSNLCRKLGELRGLYHPEGGTLLED